MSIGNEDSNFEDETRKYLETIYEFLLKRKPDEKGFNEYFNYLKNSGLNGFRNVLISFIESDEYKSLQNNQISEEKIDDLKDVITTKFEDYNSVITNFIESIYKYMLNRNPDKIGFDHYYEYLQNTGINGFNNILRFFAESDEYKSMVKNIDFEGSKEFNFKSLTNSQISDLFEKTASYWRNSGSEPKNIYWSVLSSDDFQNKKLKPVEINKFLSTGSYEVERIKRVCQIVDFDFDNCEEFLDFGCGVGRVVVNLPNSIKKVNCVDFSSAHLEEAIKNFKTYSKYNNNYSKYLINSFFDLVKLPDNQDIIHSFIVLQHNTPPVIEKIIGILLRRLSFKGLAILHIPIAKNNYNFNPHDYLNDENCGQEMEMHVLPKSNLYKLARENACEIVYSFCDGGCAGDIYSEVVVFQKRTKEI